jgi:hypothetical protein
MKLVQVQEPIHVIHSSRTFVPQAFTWRARRYRVWKVDRVKDERIESLRGSADRRVFQIRTHRGLQCSISYDGLRKRGQIESVNPKGGVK